MVGGAMMTPDKDIVDNAVGSADHTTLVAAVKAAGLVETLKSAGPFTVFAPTNAAFDKLPAGTVDSLVTARNEAHAHQNPHLPRSTRPPHGCRPEKRPGADHRGRRELTVMKNGNSVMLKDAKGGMATVPSPTWFRATA